MAARCRGGSRRRSRATCSRRFRRASTRRALSITLSSSPAFLLRSSSSVGDVCCTCVTCHSCVREESEQALQFACLAADGCRWLCSMLACLDSDNPRLTPHASRLPTPRPRLSPFAFGQASPLSTRGPSGLPCTRLATVLSCVGRPRMRHPGRRLVLLSSA